MAKREKGFVKWFDQEKGYGFITRETGGDVFVHFRSIISKRNRGLVEGQRVEFVVTQDAKGLQAEEVSILAGASAVSSFRNMRVALFILRITIFLTLSMLAIGLLVEPSRAIIKELLIIPKPINGIVLKTYAVVDLVILLAFLLGFWKKIFYFLAFISALLVAVASYRVFFHAFTDHNIILFFTWPTVAASLALCLLQQQDTFATFSKQ